jgi:DNA-binding MarR family transcriptional regulator
MRLALRAEIVNNVNIMTRSVDKVNSRPGTADAAGGPGADVGEKLHALVHKMRRHLQHALRDQADSGTPMEWRALGFFARNPDACARDLVEHSGRDKAQVARLVRMLIDRGLLESTAAPHDQRIQNLHLTAAGRHEARRLQAQRESIDQRMLAQLDDGERRQLSRLLDRMKDSLGEP